MLIRRLGMLLPCLVLGLALGACATLDTVRSEVSTYGEWPAGRVPGRYAFERLPSQQTRPQAHAALEAAARPALQAAGFAEAQAGEVPEVLVQLGARVTRLEPQAWVFGGWSGGMRPWDAPPWWGPAWGLGWQTDLPRYEREVALLIRERQGGRVLYEARAGNDGPSPGGSALAVAMFMAALTDFPAQGVNPRTVTVPLHDAKARSADTGK